jgi:hypothetical protein
MSDQSVNMLSDRLAQGPLSPAEAQQYAAALADALRRLHDQGTVVGTLEPSRIVLAGPVVKLVTGEASTGVTPYTAPEQLQGNPPDTRSDIFAFGAIFHEMLTGRKAFQGANPDELRAAILEREATPAPAEFAEFAKLLTKCLAKVPLQRWQRMQHVQMELKLHTVFARRTGQEASAKVERVQELVRTAVTELESRVSARFEAQDAKLQAAAQTEQALRAEIAALEARLASRVDAGENRAVEQEARLASYIDATEKRAAEQDAKLESHVDATGKRAAEQDARLAAAGDAAIALTSRLAGIDQTLKVHGCSIESLESAIAQTDDLVERVVEAFDSLERSVTEQNELRFVAARN